MSRIEEKKEALAAEVLADAQKKADRTLKRAEREAKKIVSEATAKAGAERDQLLSSANEEAEKAKARALATIPLEVRRLELAAKEDVISGVMDSALARLRQSPTPRGALTALALAGVDASPEDDLIIQVKEADRATVSQDFLVEVAAQAANSGGRKVMLQLDEDPADIAGGVIVRSRSGRTVFDNSFEARLARVRENLRLELAKILFE